MYYRWRMDAAARPPDATPDPESDRLFALLYHELHRLAEHHLHRGGSALTLGTTTLIHEAYLNISARDEIAFDSRNRFLAYASRAMRGLVIDYARRKRARRRGAEFEITLAEEQAGHGGTRTAEELTRLSDALDELGAMDAGLAQLVDMHFFCGFSFVEIASERGVSERTVQRDWRKARMLLHHRLGDEGASGSA